MADGSTWRSARILKAARASVTCYCIDASKSGDITETGRVWHYDKIRRSISTVAVADGLVYVADFSGFLHCLDAATGAPHWTFDMLAAVWGSPLVADGKVYFGDEDGDVVVLEAGKAMKKLAEIEHGERRLQHAGRRPTACCTS